MTVVARSREPVTRVRWRLGGSMMLLAVATAVGAGTPAFAAPHPAPNASSTAHAAHAARHHAGAGAAATGASGQARNTAPTQAHNSASAKAHRAISQSTTGSTPSAAKSSATKATPKAAGSQTAGSTGNRAQANSVTPNGVTGITVTAGYDSATVTWTAVTNATSYVVIDSTQTYNCGATAPAVTCDLTGLVPGTTYTITVTAYNGAAPVTNGTTTFTVGPPGAPTDVAATINADGSITLTWAAPADQGSGIDHYSATSSPGGFTCSTGGGTGADVTTCDIGAATLTPGTSYTFSVVANGTTGPSDTLVNDSTSSAASAAIIAPLNAPTIGATTVNADDTLTVHWAVPGVTTGIDHYTATTSPGGIACSSAAATPAATTCTTTGTLTPGVVYTVSVIAVGTTGNSGASTSSPFIFGPLNAPTNVTAMGADGMATVSWTAPEGFLAADIGYYTATSSGGDTCNTLDASSTSCTVTGLSNFTSYTFTVVAHVSGTAPNATASSVASAPSAPVTPTPSAINLKANVNGKFVTAENAGMSPLIANRSAAAGWEKFDVTQNSDGTITLMAAANGMYVSSNNGGAPVKADRSAIGAWEKFTLVDNGDGSWSLKASNGDYVSAESAGAGWLVANRTAVGAWEKFTVTTAS